MLKSRKYLALVVIVILGAFLRTWRLDKVPISLFGDEIDVGLQANSILTTGNDYLSNPYPVLFRSFAEHRLPMQLYLDVPLIKIFGLNEWGVRLPSVIFGIITIISFYFLIKKFFGPRIAILSAAFLSISPWHLVFSRQANDAGFVLPFIILGTLFFVNGLKNYKMLVVSAVLFSLSIYAYAISSLFTPLYVLSLLVIFRKKIFKYSFKKILLVGVVGIIILVPYIKASFMGSTTSRFKVISIASNDSITREVVANRRWSTSLLTRTFYNNKAIFLDEALKNYIKAFSTNFLFVDGDPNPRQSVGGFGQFYYFDLILMLIGFTAIISKLKKKKGIDSPYIVCASWLLLAPLPSIITKDGSSHAARLILMLPPLIVFSAFGFDALINYLKAKKARLLLIIFVFLMIANVTKFLHRYFVIWSNESWRFWQTGFEETISYVKKQDNEFSRIYFNNTYEPMLPRFLFWYQYDMNLFQEQFTGDEHIQNLVPGFNGFKLGDKYYFGDIQKPVENLVNKGHLIVASGEKDITNPGILDQTGIKHLETFYSPTEIPIFYVFTGNE